MTPVILLAWKRGMAEIHMLHALTNWKPERCSSTSCGPSWQQQPLQYIKHTHTVTRLSENNLHLISLWTQSLPGYDIFHKNRQTTSAFYAMRLKNIRWSFITNSHQIPVICMHVLNTYTFRTRFKSTWAQSLLRLEHSAIPFFVSGSRSGLHI